MTCTDVERVLPELLEGAPDFAFQNAFESHLRSCPDCSGLVSDLKLISSSARALPHLEDDEPSPHVWLRIAAQLRSEGIIREPKFASNFGPRNTAGSAPSLWSRWWLAPVTAVLIAAGAYVVTHKPPSQLATRQPATALTPQASVATPATAAPAPTASRSVPGIPAAGQPARPAEMARTSKPPASTVEPEPAASAEDQQFLSVVSTRAPSMRVTYEQQLQAVNAEIQEVHSYLNRNPQDMDARQHLMDAYQQKALLYRMALDRIQ